MLGIGRMAQADMAEGVEDALIGEDAIGEGYVLTRLGEAVGHSGLSVDGAGRGKVPRWKDPQCPTFHGGAVGSHAATAMAMQPGNRASTGHEAAFPYPTSVL